MSRPISAILPIALIFLGSAPVRCGEAMPLETQKKIRQLMSEASEAYRSKNHQKSIEACRKVLEIVPAGEEFDDLRMQTHYYMAVNHALLGNEKEALGEIEKAIDFGLTEMAYLEANNDLAAIRRSKGYEALAGKMRKKAEEIERRKVEKLRKFDFDLVDIDGKPLRKKDFLGHVLIVDIWGTWCPPCQMEIPHFIELHKRYRDQGLRIVGLNSERVDPKNAADVVKKFVEAKKIPYPCALVPTEVLRTIPGFSAFPTTLFFGRDGLPRAMEIGARDYAALEAIVKKILAEPRAAPLGPKDEKAPGKKAP